MGRHKRWVVKLSDDERQQLTDITRKGVDSARVITRARLLLLSEQGLLDQDVAQRQGVNAQGCGVHPQEIYRGRPAGRPVRKSQE